MKLTEELLKLCLREMPLLGNTLLNIECNAGFGLGKDVILLMVIKTTTMAMAVAMVMTKLMKIEMRGIDD